MACCYPEECCELSVTPVLVPCAPLPCEAAVCYPCLPRCPKGQVVYCCPEKRDGRSPYHKSKENSYSHHRHSTPPKRGSPSPPRYRTSCTPPECCPVCCQPSCKPVKTKYVMPCYRYEDGRIVRQLPVSAFKRNGMQDQEHSKLLGAPNFIQRCPRDVSVECSVCTAPVRICEPCKVPASDSNSPLECSELRRPIEQNQPTVLMRRACEVAVGQRQRRKPFVCSTYSADADQQVHKYISEDEKGNCCYHFEKKQNESMQNLGVDKAKKTEGYPCSMVQSCPQCQFQYDQSCLERPHYCCYFT